MANLDVRTLGVTLRSASGTIGYSSEIYDETQKKQQDTINKELYDAIGGIVYPIDGVVSGDKVLSVSNKKLSSTLSISYEKKSGDTAKKIYLNGIGGTTIASIDTTDFTKDRFIKDAELIETAEPGITIEVPYIKITFNDDTDPLRFSVKSLIDIYDGSNLKLSSKYSSTTGVTPANGVTLDAAIQNLNTRIGNNNTNINTNATNITKLGTRISNAESALGNVLNGVSSGTTSGYVTLSVGTKVNKNQSISVSAPTITVGTDIVNVTTETDKLVSAVGVKNYVSSNYPDYGDFNKVTAVVSANTTNIANALNSVSGAQSADGFISITASTKSNKSQTLTPGIRLVTTGPTLASATEQDDYVTSAVAVQEYVAAGVSSELETLKGTVQSNSTRISTLEGNRLKSVSGASSMDGLVKITASTVSNNTQTLTPSVTTTAISSASSTSNGLVRAYDVKQTCISGTTVGSVTYDEWDTIIG